MDMPEYEGIIEKWKVNLIIHRAKRCGFKPHEIPDALQEAVLVVLEFEYDPDHAKGAIESTALVPVIDNRLRKMKRSEARYQTHVEKFGLTTEKFDCGESGQREIDVATVMAALTPEEERVCRGLANGVPILQIANQMDCSWHSIARMIRRLREFFEDLDMDRWVQK